MFKITKCILGCKWIHNYLHYVMQFLIVFKLIIEDKYIICYFYHKPKFVPPLSKHYDLCINLI